MTNNSVFLLAEDDEDDKSFFLDALNLIDPDIHCLVVPNGDQALRLLDNDFIAPPDFIFLDMNMPVMNGLKCLEAIKKIPHLDAVPVIIYSTTTDKETAAKCLRAGARHFLVKPSTTAALSEAIRKLTGT